ncbi:MAG: hypothetical protein HEP71_02750 [Roseivirga sp.]|nr:hypothetical protein [Roseivirga sp.]
MGTNFETKLRSVFICIFTACIITGCGFLDLFDTQLYTQHEVSVANRSSQDFYVDYVVESRLIDTTGNQNLVNYVLIDKSIIIEKSKWATLFLRQFDEHQRFGVEYSQIKNLITQLSIYRIEGNDTLFANPDLLDENKWEYFNNDPLPLSDIYHTYVFLIKDEDFD